MNRKYILLMAIILAFSSVVLTGCGVRINGKDYMIFDSSKERDMFREESSEVLNNEELKEDIQATKELVISSGAGNIDIKKSNSSQIEVSVRKKVKGFSESDKQVILDNMKVQLERTGNKSEIVLKTQEGKDFWKWQKDNYALCQITLNFDISIPEGIDTLNIKLGAGNVDIKDISAKLVISNGAGNINLENISALKDSNIEIGAGNIDFNGNIVNADSYNISTGAGNIKFEVPDDAKMSLEAKTGVGSLSGDFINNDGNKMHFTGDINGGGTTVKLNVGVGNIKVG